jgi:hypothetical protein
MACTSAWVGALETVPTWYTLNPQLGSKRGNRFDDRLGAALRFKVDPSQVKLPPEPGHLPFGKLVSTDLNQRNRLSERALAAQVLDNLMVAERLHSRLILGQAALQELLRFGHPSAAEHGIDPGVDSPLQIRRGAREAEVGG